MQDFLGSRSSTAANSSIDGDSDDQKGSNCRHQNDHPLAMMAMPSSASSAFTWRSRRINDETANRHRTDFVVLDVLGSGGFGKVYKVRNKLDSKFYALKVVPMPECIEFDNETKFSSLNPTGKNFNDESPSSSPLRRVIREVEILSSIPSNDNVVRYYSAWVEKTHNVDDLVSHDNDDDYNAYSYDESSTDYDRTSATYSTSDRMMEQNFDTNYDSKSANTDCVRGPVCHLCQSSYDDWEVGLGYWGLIDSVLQPLNLCVECYKKSLPKHVDTTKMNIRKVRPYRTQLYILMEYCDSTLEETIKLLQKNKVKSGENNVKPNEKDQTVRNSSDIDDDDCFETICWSYFRQTVRGVAHLHANGIIHRDIKPNNVFLTNEGYGGGTVKIGDLGLATVDKKTASSGMKNGDERSDENAMIRKQSSGVGTYLYRAPEITTGMYNEKCDVYSLGILLVEIFSKFETAMERAKVLGDLKGMSATPGRLPVSKKAEEGDKSAFHIQLAHRMTAVDPRDRPSCVEILDELENRSVFRSSKQSNSARSISSLSLPSSMMNENYDENLSLREKDREIERLQNLLKANGISYEKENTE